MPPPDDAPDLGSSVALTVVFALIAGLGAVDLALDLQDGTPAHAAIEGLVVIVGLAAAVVYARRVRELAREAQDLRTRTRELAGHLEASRADAARWQRDAHAMIEGLGAAIDRQLDQWVLSPAEKEIALLLLKGLSHKEIAATRDVTETTVRQQARSIYRKAGLTGRNDLAAFFLEDLLAPRG